MKKHEDFGCKTACPISCAKTKRFSNSDKAELIKMTLFFSYIYTYSIHYLKIE